MADPLSITAGIIAVIQATDYVLTSCQTYIGRVKSAAADVDKVFKEASLLKGIFINLQELAQDDPDNERLKDLISPGGPVASCKEALVDIHAKLQAQTSQARMTTTRKLLWPFESKKLEEILERIRKQKPNLLLALETDSANISREIRSGVMDIQTSLESTHMREKKEKILDWLQPNDPKEKHFNSRRIHEEGSNQWVLEHPEFLRWTKEPRQNIWLHGIPGCGKTIICSTAIEYVKSLCASQPDRKLAYYYFDFNDASNQKCVVLLRSLIFQLCVGMDSLPEDLNALYDECNRGRSAAAEEDLVKVLFDLLNSDSMTYILIDGLDECPFDQERPRLESLVLESIGQHPGNYSFLFTSRKEFDIEECMKQLSKQVDLHIIPIQTEDVDSDVRLHVQRFISGHKRISTWSPSIRREIEETLVNGSQGMFRWIELQLRSIGSCVLPGAARKKLKQLPSTLYESYDRILESVSEENIIAVRSALVLLAHSLRPITVEELADFVLINVEDQVFESEERSEDPLSVVLELCSSLVTVTSSSQSDIQLINEGRPFGMFRLKGRAMIVRFSHYSVKEYITSNRHEHAALSDFHFTECNAHQTITEALLVYIVTVGSTESATRPVFEQSGEFLIFYAAQYWPKHYRHVPLEKRRRELTELVQTLYNTAEPGPYIYWINLGNQDYTMSGSSYYRPGRILSDFPPPIYIASLLGDLATWQWLIDNRFRIDDPSGTCNLGDPLQAAALGNHVEIVKGLLEQGAQVNTDHGDFGDPLQAAAFGGGLETVKLLLENGAIINTEHGEYGNALIASAYRGHTAIAKLLLEMGADAELSSRKHGKAIAGAAASGESELIKILLLQGNNIDDPNGTKGSALYCASSAGDLQVVRMLVKAGADVNLVSGELHTALQAACNEGHVEVVKFLLANGADVNLFGGSRDSALQACIDHGNMEIMEMLLAHGADIDHEGGLYKSPLHCATFRGKSVLAEILLDRGAKFNDEIFLMAIQYEHESLVSRMLRKGVNVNAQNKDDTALQLAIKNENTKTIDALLSNPEIEIDARAGEHGTTAFQLALSRGLEKVARKLLSMGASVHMEGGDEYKPLTAAVRGKNDKLIRLVLEAGADVNGHRGGWYGSALNEAARKGLPDICELLLGHGADINEFSGRDEDSTSTPLQEACEFGNFETAKLLISRGAHINAPAGEAGTALACVLKPKWSSEVKPEDVIDMTHYLLDRGADLSCPVGINNCSGFHKGSTPLDTAIWCKKKDIIDLLLTRGAQLCPSSLRIAADRGDDDLIRQYIKRGGDVTHDTLAFCKAISSRNESTIQLFIEVGADVNGQHVGEYTYGCPLGYAVNDRDRKLVHQLLELGADPSSMAGKFGPVLGQAINKGENEIATMLIERGADLNATKDDFPAPLGMAAGGGNEEMITQLLEAGADVNGDGGYALAVACTRGKIHIVQMLLDAGADPNIGEGLPLQRAAEWNHVDICKLLISKGVEVNAQGGKEGNALRAVVSNMHTCRSDGPISTIRYLLGIGADPNAPRSGKYVSTLAAAMRNGHGISADALIAAGADINTHDPALDTALTNSARYAAVRWTLKLLDYGADPHLTGGRWGSPLHAAAQVGNPEIVERLLDGGVSADLVAGRYGHVLQAACNPAGSVDYMGVLRLLLARRSNVNARGGKYETALQCAAKHGKLDAVQLLLENGADPMIKGGKFGSAAEAARENKHWHVYNFLERYIRKNGLAIGS